MKTFLINIVFTACLIITANAYTHGGRTGADGCHFTAGSSVKHCHHKSPRKSTGKAEKVCIYIYKYPDATPAYIGISNRPEKRWKQHSEDGRPFANLNKSVVSCHPSRAEALAQEKFLIRQHCRPALFNKTHCRK